MPGVRSNADVFEVGEAIVPLVEVLMIALHPSVPVSRSPIAEKFLAGDLRALKIRQGCFFEPPLGDAFLPGLFLFLDTGDCDGPRVGAMLVKGEPILRRMFVRNRAL